MVPPPPPSLGIPPQIIDISEAYLYALMKVATNNRIGLTPLAPPPGFLDTLPFAAEVYNSLRCVTCGKVPSATAAILNQRFSFCARCGDRRYRFCSRHPCFAAFWKNGHKNECKAKNK
jgi:hypothetical protein